MTGLGWYYIPYRALTAERLIVEDSLSNAGRVVSKVKEDIGRDKYLT